MHLHSGFDCVRVSGFMVDFVSCVCFFFKSTKCSVGSLFGVSKLFFFRDSPCRTTNLTAILRVKLQLQAPVSFENGNAQYNTFTSCRRSSMKLVTACYFLLFFSITGVDTFGGKKKKKKKISETRWISKYF